MSENINRPAAVWRERGDALHTMECSNCKLRRRLGKE